MECTLESLINKGFLEEVTLEQTPKENESINHVTPDKGTHSSKKANISRVKET